MGSSHRLPCLLSLQKSGRRNGETENHGICVSYSVVMKGLSINTPSMTRRRERHLGNHFSKIFYFFINFFSFCILFPTACLEIPSISAISFIR